MSDAQPPTDRRTQILRSAAQVFLKHGFDATSMNQVAEFAKVTKPGLYYHFKSKQDLLFAILSFALDELERETLRATVAAVDSVDRLRRILLTHATMICENQNGAITTLIMDETRSLTEEDRRIIEHRKRKYIELIRATLDQLAREGRLVDIDTGLGAFTVLGCVMWLPKWYDETGRLEGKHVAESVTDLALRGILKPTQSPAVDSPS